MKISEIINFVDDIKPNAFSAVEKTVWLNEVEGMAQTDVMLFAPSSLISYVYESTWSGEVYFPNTATMVCSTAPSFRVGGTVKVSDLTTYAENNDVEAKIVDISSDGLTLTFAENTFTNTEEWAEATLDFDGSDAEMLVGPPHSKIYYTYLIAMIDFANGEYDKYQNTMTLFNSFFQNFATWYREIYHPADGEAEVLSYYISAYAIAVKHGFMGTEEEWLATLKGDTGSAGPNEITSATDTPFTGMLKGAGGKAAQAAPGIDYQTASVKNVMDYGAAGDGASDDTAAIQSCLDALSESDAAYFPAGTYLVSGLIVTASRVRLCGSGILKLKPGSNAALLTLQDSIASVVEGITFDGNQSAQGSIESDVTDARSGIVLKGSYFSTIRHCVVKNCVLNGVEMIGYYNESVFHNSDESHIIGNYIQSNGNLGLLVDSVADLLIDGNNIEFNTATGCWLGSTAGVSTANITFVNNNIISNDAMGIDAQYCRRCVFSENQIRNNGTRGLNLIGGVDLVASHNDVHMNGRLVAYSAGIVVGYNARILIKGNVITNTDFTATQGYPVELYTVTGCRVENNMAADNLVDGILVSDSTDVTVRGNIGVDDTSIPASGIAIADDGGYFTATTVEAALAELAALKANISATMHEIYSVTLSSPANTLTLATDNDSNALSSLNLVECELLISVPEGCSSPTGVSAYIHAQVNEIEANYRCHAVSDSAAQWIVIGRARNVWSETKANFSLVGGDLVVNSLSAYSDGTDSGDDSYSAGNVVETFSTINQIDLIMTGSYTLPVGTNIMLRGRSEG